MAPILVQAVSGAHGLLQLAPLQPGSVVSDLKDAIAARLGIAPELQRLVARGRVLLDPEDLEAVGLATGGRVFLALVKNIARDAVHASAPTASDNTIVPVDGANLAPEAEVPQFDAFEVIVRAVDAQSEVLVMVDPDASVTEFKGEALRRLLVLGQCCTADVQRYNFVCDGRLLGDHGRMREQTMSAGSRVVVVPRQQVLRRPSRRSCGYCIYYPLACMRRCQGGLVQLMLGLPFAALRWMADTWEDPWSLVRPNLLDESQQHGRRIQTFRIHARAFRYGPGQNPHGEDLTVLLSQGLLGGS